MGDILHWVNMIFDCGLNFDAEHSQNKQYDSQHGIIVNNSTLGSIIPATPGLQALSMFSVIRT